jgi:hypothetical protein
VQATSSNTFVSSDVTIDVGDTVTWTNTGGSHNVVFDDGLFTQPSAMAVPAASWPAGVSRTFSAAGRFTYYCVAHRSIGMTGVVNVVAPAEQPPAGGGGGGSPGGGSPGGGSPGGEPSPTRTPFKVTLRVSDATPAKAGRLRFSGTVRPAQDGRSVLIQLRTRHGGYRTVGKARLKDAGAKQSAFSVRLRVSHDAVFRARMPGRGDHTTGTSHTRRINLG